MVEKKKPEEKIQGVKISIEWNIPDDIVARYATNMVIQKLEHEFLISFFEVKPPIILGDPKTIEEKLKNLKSVPANCVAQIIVAHNKLPPFIDALSRNIERIAVSVDDAEDVKK